MKPSRSAIALFAVAFIALLGVLRLPHLAPDRNLHIAAPRAVSPGQTLQVEVSAITRVMDGEHVGFLQIETSADNGQSWHGIAYKSDMGRRGDHWFSIDAGPEPHAILIRARAAFRDGRAGDVDLHGQPLDWGGTWDAWAQPPAVVATVLVR